MLIISIQIRCKVCENTFSTQKSYSQQVVRKCPYCGHKLSLIKSRNHFDVYKCMNPKCSHYKAELKKLSKEDKAKYKKNPSAFSLHYITRVFNASLDRLESIQLKIAPSKGLILTYYVNYGLSLRKTALILFEIHDIKLSHQTVANYAQAASHLLFPWLDNFKHDLNSYQCGDETYVKVLGKKAYVFFMCDVKKKIIFFKVTQVIGLTNDDPVSKEHRPAKQIIERLNRTFKYSYAIKNGFNSLESANDFMCLFTTIYYWMKH